MNVGTRVRVRRRYYLQMDANVVTIDAFFKGSVYTCWYYEGLANFREVLPRFLELLPGEPEKHRWHKSKFAVPASKWPTL